MDSFPTIPIIVGACRGRMAAGNDENILKSWLEQRLAKPAARPAESRGGSGPLEVHPPERIGGEQWQATIFKQPSRLELRFGSQRCSPAKQAFEAGSHLLGNGIGAPRPLAWIERWERGRLIESYLVSRHESGISCLRRELIHLYRHEPMCVPLMSLLKLVARGIRAMHDTGIFHGQLCNHNILLRRKDAENWDSLMFRGLHRSRVLKQLSPRDRARDMALIRLPSDFLRVFKAMYMGNDRVTPSFERWGSFYRKRFALQSTFQRLTRPVAQPDYPHEKDLWIWDEKSAQAMVTLKSKDRHRYYSTANALRIAGYSTRAAPAIYRRYGALLKSACRTPVALLNRIGMTVNTKPETWSQERAWLDGLGKIPVLGRFYRHQTELEWEHTARCLRELHQAGHPVSIALVQDRHAVKKPEHWDAFVQNVMTAVCDIVEWVEIGHAINRVKWGIWTLDEYLRLLQPLTAWQHSANIRCMGPSVIDFEYHYLAAALRRIGGSFRFQALSHHLYVDRRGAPENTQAGYSTLEKCVLARAIAEWSPNCDARLIISEVNWPLKDTYEYSPVGSPYVTPGPRANDPGVNEDDYANFMIRYLVITLTSGMVERVYWWRLAAYGFGLIDDLNPRAWRPRPAYRMCKTFLDCLGNARFTHKPATPAGIEAYAFQRKDGERVVLAYAHPEPSSWTPEFTFRNMADGLGEPYAPGNSSVTLTGRPTYFRNVSNLDTQP